MSELTPEQIAAEEAVELPDREAMSLLNPTSALGGMPLGGLSPDLLGGQDVPVESDPATTGDPATTSDAGDVQQAAPANQINATNLNSEGASQGAGATQSAPVTQSS